jgi:hypothetical protein
MGAPVVQHTTPLGADGDFVSDWIKVQSHHRYVEGAVTADAAGTVVIEQSNDGQTVALAGEDGEVVANEGFGIKVELLTRYWRVSYSNGGAAQKALDLVVAARPSTPNNG